MFLFVVLSPKSLKLFRTAHLTGILRKINVSSSVFLSNREFVGKLDQWLELVKHLGSDAILDCRKPSASSCWELWNITCHIHTLSIPYQRQGHGLDGPFDQWLMWQFLHWSFKGEKPQTTKTRHGAVFCTSNALHLLQKPFLYVLHVWYLMVSVWETKTATCIFSGLLLFLRIDMYGRHLMNKWKRRPVKFPTLKNATVWV